MAKQTKEELLKAIAKLSPDEQKKLLEELEEKRSPSYNWQRDPFAIAEELSGSILKGSSLGTDEYTITDARGWRVMDAKRAAQYGIAHRTPGTLHAFPLRRFKAREQGQQKAEPYHILAIIASSANYPTGLITINGLALGRISIGATELWTKLGIQESDQKNAPFLKPGALELELANTRIAGLRKSYNIENISPNDAQGYKIPLRGL